MSGDGLVSLDPPPLGAVGADPALPGAGGQAAGGSQGGTGADMSAVRESTDRGLCQCGCGESTTIAMKTRRRYGHVKGQPLPFVNAGHSMRGPCEPLTDRFWRTVDRRNPETCWPWTAARDPKGYGRIMMRPKGTTSAHRIAWVLTHGPIPPGLCVLHTCDNPPCCNPAHLFLGTDADNVHDMMRKGRDRRPVGESAPTAKLTEHQVLAIRRVHSETGVGSRRLAKQFGMGRATISQLLKRQTWAHLPQEAI